MQVVLVSAERAPEVAQAPSKRASNLWKSLWPEHQQRDHKNEQQMCWLKDVADHDQQLSR